jgi:predicted Zn-dependent peptidase
MLQRGANSMSSNEIAEKFESMGSRFRVQASKSYVSFDLTCLAENFMPSFELMLNILDKPDFPGSELDKLRKQVEDWIKADEDDLYKYTSQGALEALSATIIRGNSKIHCCKVWGASLRARPMSSRHLS